VRSAQNALREIQRATRHVSSWTATSVQRCWNSCGYSDRHPQCDGEVSLRCQQELHTQGFPGVPTGKNPEDSSQVTVEAMQWVLLYMSIGHDSVTENMSHSTGKMCRSTIIHSFSSNSQITCKRFRKHVVMVVFSCFDMWNSCPEFVCTFQLYCAISRAT
jgi:hypothetical protein